jgi:hypothetical protein
MFRALSPIFINKLDENLLLKHPIIWMSKIHYVLWHGTILWALSFLLGMIMPIDLTRRIEVDVWYFLFTVLSIIILCFWIYRYLIFNNEKNYGNRNFTDEYLNGFFVFFCVAYFLLVPAPFVMSLEHRIATIQPDDVVLQDMDKLNELDPYLAHTGNNYFNWYDSTNNQQYCTLKKLAPYGGVYYTPYYLRYDSLHYPMLRSESAMMRAYHPIYDKQLLVQKINEYIAIANKYGVNVNRSASEIADTYLGYLKQEKVKVSEIYSQGSYQYELITVMQNLCDAKFKPIFIFTPDYLWTIFYFAMGITLFLLLFKMTYWQQFLIMIVVIMLYPLIMFIFSQLMPYSGFFRGGNFFMGTIVALVLYSGVTLVFTAKQDHHFQPIHNIFNQIFYISLIFTPLLILGFLNETTHLFHYNDYNSYFTPATEANSLNNAIDAAAVRYDQQLDVYYYQYWHAQYELWMKGMQYFGILLSVITLPFFKDLFVKQISIPEKA